MQEPTLLQAVERSKAYRFCKFAVGGSAVPRAVLVRDLLRMARLRSLSTQMIRRAGKSDALAASRSFFVGSEDPVIVSDTLDQLLAAPDSESVVKLLREQPGAVSSALDGFRAKECPDAAEAFLAESETLLRPCASDAMPPGEALYRIASRTLAFAAQANACWRAPKVPLAELVPAHLHEQCQYFFEKCDSVPPAVRIAELAPVAGIPVPGSFFSSTVTRHVAAHLALPLRQIRAACPDLRGIGDRPLREAVRIAREAATYAQRHGMDLWESHGVALPIFAS